MGGAQPPFLYDPVPKQSSRIPYNSFDPKAVSRASLTPKPPRPKSKGPLISFNQHPDSYLIVPYGNTNATPMNPSVKTWIKWTRAAQLPLRCLELLGALGLLVMMILIKNVEVTTGWIMRIVPGVAIAHTMYGIYHLARKASGRTPASSASYMLFAAFFDVSIIPFYAFGALVAKTRDSAWATILSNQDLMSIFPNVVFLLATVSSGLHLISLGLSIYLAVTFRRITELPPDMNPLEDHLTSRPHKRNKSSVSATTVSEKRSSLPSESNRSSGVPYEDLEQPPTIPFMHTRTGSNESFSTYQSSTPPGSRGSHRDFPNRQYQIETNHSPRPSTGGASNRNSVHGSIPPSYREVPQSDTASQRSLTSPYRASSPPKRSSYTGLPLSDRSPRHSAPALGKANPMKEAWYNNDAFKTASVDPPRTRTSSPNFSKKGLYQALQQSSEELSMAHPNGLGANPPTPRHSKAFRPQRESPLAEISNNRTPSSSDIASISNYSQDGIDDFPKRGISGSSRTKSKYYGELKPTAQLTPVLVGADSNRQVSSGIDFESVVYSNEKGSFRRDISGKIAEEGRSTRFRRVSGMLQ